MVRTPPIPFEVVGRLSGGRMNRDKSPKPQRRCIVKRIGIKEVTICTGGPSIAWQNIMHLSIMTVLEINLI